MGIQSQLLINYTAKTSAISRVACAPTRLPPTTNTLFLTYIAKLSLVCEYAWSTLSPSTCGDRFVQSRASCPMLRKNKNYFSFVGFLCFFLCIFELCTAENRLLGKKCAANVGKSVVYELCFSRFSVNRNGLPFFFILDTVVPASLYRYLSLNSCILHALMLWQIHVGRQNTSRPFRNTAEQTTPCKSFPDPSSTSRTCFGRPLKNQGRIKAKLDTACVFASSISLPKCIFFHYCFRYSCAGVSTWLHMVSVCFISTRACYHAIIQSSEEERLYPGLGDLGCVALEFISVCAEASFARLERSKWTL
jgi:hypothetical protein